MIAVALSFDAGILLCTDAGTSLPARIPRESTNIFQKAYGLCPRCARSIFLVSDPSAAVVAALHGCERALEALPAAEQTIDRMRATIEQSLRNAYATALDEEEDVPSADTAVLVALYSPIDRQCSTFRTAGTHLTEFFGYDCEGVAAYLGHVLIRDRYTAAESMDSLDLSTVFSIAIDALESVRSSMGRGSESAEIMVMYANGRASDVQRIHRDSSKERKLAFLGHLSGA